MPFGQLLELIVGGVSQIAMMGSAAADAINTKKYTNSISRTQEEANQAALDLERKRIAAGESAAQIQLQTEELKNIRARKIAALAVFTIISLSILGVAIYYYSTVEADSG